MAFQTWETLVNAYQFSSMNSGEVKEKATIEALSPGKEVAGQALVVPANYLNVGSIIRFTASGWFETAAATKPLLTLGVYFGKAEAAKALGVTRAQETPEAAKKQQWTFHAWSRVNAVGTAGKVITAGFVTGITTPVETAKVGTTVNQLNEQSETGGEVAMETGTAQMLLLGATWGTSAATNRIVCLKWLVEILN